MRCRDVERWVTGYIGGDLDDNRASALRGHARSCSACASLIDDHLRMVEAAAEVEPPDAPPDLWMGIEKALDAAEATDAGRSRAWLWWPRLRPIATGFGALAATAVILFMWTRTRDGAREPEVRLFDQAPTIVQSSGSHTQGVRNEIERADQRYMETIRDLRGLADEALPALAVTDRRRFAETMQRLELESAQERRHIGGATPTDSRERDALYASYQAQIHLLTHVAMGEVPEPDLEGR